MRLLFAEDQPQLRRSVTKALTAAGYSVDAAADGAQALDDLDGVDYDAIVLDVMMPRVDGLTVLRTLRGRGDDTPVLLLTARDAIDHRVEGLDAGADDYLVKPFAMEELLARLRVLTRKAEVQQTHILELGNTRLDTSSFILSAPSGSYQLANKEYQTMLLLMRNPGVLLPPGRFLENIWDPDSRAEENTVWTYISYLRRKLAAIGSDLQIITRRNAGYLLERKP